MKKLFVLFTLAGLAGCNARAPEERLRRSAYEKTSDRVYAEAPPQQAMESTAYVACLDEGAACTFQSRCCGETFCSDELQAYGVHVCTAPLAAGDYCTEDTHCESGVCSHNVCAAADCRPAGEECYTDPEACCPGLFCDHDTNAYGVAFCTPPRPAGDYCFEHAHCASGVCTDNACE